MSKQLATKQQGLHNEQAGHYWKEMSTRKSCLLIDSCAPITLKSRPMSFICDNFWKIEKNGLKTL